MSNLKNVEAFNKLISLYTGYGGTQVPGSPNLRVESLSLLLTRAREALLQVSVTKTGYESATNSREVTFVQTKLLASRLLSELKSCGALPQTVADAAGMVRKIKGRVLSDKPEVSAAVTDAGKPVVKRPRVTGSGYDSVRYHFEKLVETLVAEPTYASGIPELQVPALKQTLQQLRAAQEAVANAYSQLSQARIHRNNILYGKWGVHYTAMAIKQQVRARFGFTSLQAAEVSRITFNPIKLG